MSVPPAAPPVRTSPLADVQAVRVAQWTERDGMCMAARFLNGGGPDAVAWLVDVSHRRRFGCKGPGAARWLREQGLPVPQAPNSWAGFDAALVARLAHSEFMVEAIGEDPVVRQACTALAEATRKDALDDVFMVPHADAALVLGGSNAGAVLRQVCNVDFDALALEAMPLVMTTMVGVSVLVIPYDAGAGRQYRVWCDPSFGPYLWETLLAVVEDCGGAPLGLDAFEPLAAAPAALLASVSAFPPPPAPTPPSPDHKEPAR